MKKLFKIILCAFVVCVVSGQEGQLSEKQKSDVASLLKGMREELDSRKPDKIKNAVSLLNSVVNNPNAAMDLFEKSYKKINFDDNGNKKEKDWREWKTQNKEKLSNPVNKRALCYQIRWALICLDAFMKPGEELEPQQYVDKAVALIRDLVQDADVLGGADPLFNTSVLDGPIALVYGFREFRPENWPGSIMQFDRVINQLALAKAREEKDYRTLRKGWNLVIGATRKMIEEIRANAEKEAKKTAREAPGLEGRRSMASFLHQIASEDIDMTLEALEMIREADCYRAGDQWNAAGNMIRIITNSKNSDRREMYINAMKQMMESQTDREGGAEGGRGKMKSPETNTVG